MVSSVFPSICTTRILLLVLTLLSTACGTKTPEPTTSDKLKKVWIAQTVRENSTVVYTRGLANNIRNYSSYKLDLSNSPTGSITDWDGITFLGQYELLSDTRLALKNLNPQPAETNGTIEFIINSISDSQLDLTRVTASPKTGGTTNQYVLTTL